MNEISFHAVSQISFGVATYLNTIFFTLGVQERQLYLTLGV